VKGDPQHTENLFPDEPYEGAAEQETDERSQYRAHLLKINAQLLEMYD
jgi:hypothetical protein